MTLLGLNSYAAASLVFGPQEITFGKVKKGETATRVVKVFNTSPEKVNILRVYSDCDCTEIEIGNKTLEPSGGTELTVKFDSAKQYAGFFSKTAYVSYDFGEAQVKITGEVVPVGSFQNPPAVQVINSRILAEKTVPVTAMQRNTGMYVAYFYSAKCRECINVKAVLEKVLAAYREIEMNSFDVAERESRLLLESMAVMYNVEDERKLTVPVVFAASYKNGLFLQGSEIKEEPLKSFFSAAEGRNTGMKPPWELASAYEKAAVESIKNRFGRFEIFPVLFAGLVDGVNPCAFGTIVFFVVYLTMILKKTQPEIFWVGVNFILGVFAAYFALGAGFLKFISSVRGMPLLYNGFYLFTGVLSSVLAVLSFVDSYSVKRAEKGFPAKVILKLPDFFRWKIYGIIEKYTKLKYLVAVAFLLGVVVSLLEFFCTGQVYLPTIMYISGLPDYKFKASAYLVLYSFMFVTPLIFVFSLVFWGIKSDVIEMFGRKYMFAAKFLTGTVFLLLAALIFITAW